MTAFLICIAAANAYVGGAARVALALARAGAAPRFLGRVDAVRSVPVGGLCFVGTGAAVFLGLLLTGRVTVAELILFPNATFVAIYLGGFAGGNPLAPGYAVGGKDGLDVLGRDGGGVCVSRPGGAAAADRGSSVGVFTFFKGRWSYFKARLAR